MRLNFVWYFSYFNDDSKVLCEKERDEHKVHLFLTVFQNRLISNLKCGIL